MVRVFPLRQKAFPYFRQCQLMVTEMLEGQVEVQPVVKCVDNLNVLINLELYSLFMAILTLYSIFAIDIEKAFFGQHAAYIFGYVHIVCIVIFLMDMVLSWICKLDFKWSFYFWIDVISTTSMIMEITWVDNFLTDNSNLPGVLTIAKVVKASRLSRIGGRAAKIILMFLAYLKTKKKEQQEKARNEAKNTESVIGDSNINPTATIIEGKTKEQIELQAEEEAIEEQQVPNELPNKIDLNKKELDPIVEERISERSDQNQNSQISPSPEKNSVTNSKDSLIQTPFLLGKRRSKMTHSSDSMVVKKRGDRTKVFDMSNIVQRMLQTFKLQPLNRINTPLDKSQQIQHRWTELCQQQEQARKQSREKIKSNKQNFKLGQILKQRIQKNIIIMIMSLIIILPLISADTWFNKDPTIDQLIHNYFQVANTFNNTETKRQFFQDMVSVAEEGSYPVLWMKVNGNLTYPGTIMPAIADNPPLSDFMAVQRIEQVGTDFDIVFNGRNISETNAIINIARSCFITILLIFSTIIFMYSIETNALTPLEKMSVSINKISINPFDALREINDNEKKEDNDSELQTNVLEQAVKKMTKVLALGAGQSGSELISNTVDTITSENGCNIISGTKIHGVFLYIKLTHFEKMSQIWQEQFLPTLNKISTYLHDIVMENGGQIVDTNPPYFLFFWNTPEDATIQPDQTKYYQANDPLKNLGQTIQTQKVIQVVLRSYLQINIALTELNKKSIDEWMVDYEFEPFFVQAGIHIGDSFKGSVGDSLKIEVKCMGEDLKFAKNLCEMADRYHLSNIVSQQICLIMSDSLAQAHLRKIDYVREPGDEDYRYWLCTYDFTLFTLMGSERKSTNMFKKKKRTRKPEKTFREKKERSLVLKNRADTLSRLKVDPIDVIMPYSSVEKKCLKPFGEKFYATWNIATDNYYCGEWDEAAPLFESINERTDLGYKDPVSLLFLERIAALGKDPEEGWEKAVDLEMD